MTYDSLNSENQMVHAGYFGEDRGSGDEAIQVKLMIYLKIKKNAEVLKTRMVTGLQEGFIFKMDTKRRLG